MLGCCVYVFGVLNAKSLWITSRDLWLSSAITLQLHVGNAPIRVVPCCRRIVYSHYADKLFYVFAAAVSHHLLSVLPSIHSRTHLMQHSAEIFQSASNYCLCCFAFLALSFVGVFETVCFVRACGSSWEFQVSILPI